ncbi:MAG TPA: hypothetical protein VGM39_13195 [Kofleriaceae bacterium]|jgi:hypothetical protein
MAKHPLTKKEERHQLNRRALIKWSVAAGAALGVSRATIFQILEGSAGREVAHAAAENPVCRSVHIVAGQGGLAWYQLLWPHVDVAMANSSTFAWHKPGQATLVNGTNKPLAIGPDTPFASLDPSRQMTCFVAGTSGIHMNQAPSTSQLMGQNIFSIASALQASVPAVVPLITIGNTVTATGAAGGALPTNVGTAADIQNLFNSAASRAGGLLRAPSDAALYKEHYDALIQLNRAQNRSTTRSAYTTARGAAKLLGTNLADKLQVTDADKARYGITAGLRTALQEMATTLCIAVKAFKMGLTNSIVMPALADDPHGAFAGAVPDVTVVPPALKKMFDAFMDDLTNTVDDNTLQPLSNDTVMTICGDLPKNALDRNAWPDGVPSNSNHVYVWGAGHLKTGWFGKLNASGPNMNTAQGFNGDGDLAPYNATETAKYAMASVAYAIAKRDERAIAPFANGIEVSGKFGIPKDV